MLLASALQLIQGVATFTKLYVCNTNLVLIFEMDKWKTLLGHYEYLVMPAVFKV